MKSSDARAAALCLAILALALWAVDSLRPRLTARYGAAKRQEDAVILPRPELTPLLSLGYRAALADLIFAHVLVSQGLHFQEKRRFELAATYVDTITTLDPRYREAYKLADTLITMQPVASKVEDYRATRRLQDRGLAAFPYDAELWLVAGQFMAYFGAAQMPPGERESWRLEGARKLARSCELVSSNENLPFHCIAAAALYSRSGRREAVKSVLERLLTVSDDPEILRLASGALGRLLGQDEREQVEERNQRLRALWRHDFTFISLDALLLLGPKFDPARCAGVGRAGTPECASSFRAWAETL